MSFRPFTSESYAEGERPDAWRDVLSAVGLQPATKTAFYDGHATASHRTAPGLALSRLSAGSQSVAAVPQAHEDLPIALLAIEDGAVLRSGDSHRIVPSGHLLLLPRTRDWSIAFQRDLRAIVLSVTSDALHGRISGKLKFAKPQVIAPIGLADVVCRTIEATARTLETLSDAEWSTVAQSLVDLLLTLAHRQAVPVSEAGSSATQAATLHRICQSIERRLDDATLTPASVAQAEGISERYLQKLFESAGDNFSHYVRERRLQRAWTDLSNPAEAHHSISEIAYRWGFADSAHFSRSFRARFGLSPREFRQQKAEQAVTSAVPRGQRGWPQDALAQQRASPTAAPARSDIALPAPANDQDAQQRHHHLAVSAERVHWGYFSRSLPPQLEIASGDTITIETLTQHASDDPELMIAGDEGALSVFGWTRTKKNVDRRGAGPMDASVFGRGAGEGFGVHICTGPVAIKDAQPGDVLEVRILDIVPRPSRNPNHAGRVFGSSVAAW
ncbi:helix-turn-helix domain-containing protein, partial [Bradyrhizobium sp.]